MKKFNEFIRAAKETASTPIEKKFDFAAGPAINENASADTPYVKWHPECNMLLVGHTPIGLSFENRASLYEIAKFVEKAAKRGDMTVTIHTRNASGMFPSVIHVTQKGRSKLYVESSYFCTPRDVDEKTYSEVVSIIEAMGGKEADFYEARGEWFKRYNTLVHNGKPHVVADVMLNAELTI